MSLCSMLLIAPTCAQEVEVPDEVLATFEEMYPNAINATWEEEDTQYTVNFEMDGSTIIAVYSEDGSWLKSETDIEFDDLPTAAQAYIKDEFVVELYHSIVKLEVPEETLYHVSLETETELVKLTFDEDGNVLEKKIEDN